MRRTEEAGSHAPAALSQELRPTLKRAVDLLGGLIQANQTAGKNFSELEALWRRARKDLDDWARSDVARPGSNSNRCHWVVFHPRIGTMCFTAAVTDGEAAVAAGMVRARLDNLRYSPRGSSFSYSALLAP